MIDAYYAGRGLDPDGRPEPGTSAELGLERFVADPASP
jgi:aldehyde:ferredoxin oxidoreductase